MGHKQVVLRHLIILFPTSGEWVSKRANRWVQWGARAMRAVQSKRMSEQCEQANGEVSDSVLTSRFMALLNHCGTLKKNVMTITKYTGFYILLIIITILASSWFCRWAPKTLEARKPALFIALFIGFSLLIFSFKTWHPISTRVRFLPSVCSSVRRTHF